MIAMYIWDVLINAFMILSIVGTFFWMYMLIDCSTQETSQNKMMWIVMIVVTHWIGALIYYFYQRPKQLKRESEI